MSEQTASSVEEQGIDGADELAPGTELLQGQYKITAFLNAGGFGITYRAQDSLERPIVIKECFPGAFCRRSRAIVQARSRAHQTEFASIVRHFVEEAKSLAKLNHPNIVGVHQVWEENDTAYMALDFVEGRDLLDIIEDEELVTTIKPAQMEKILRQVLDAIGFVHSQDMLHRDISPDNILVRPDLTPVLIDFGAARQQVNTENKVLSALRVVKDGYSPQEFYVTGSEQGPYSDLYALGASFYHVITGTAPPDSQTRLSAIATGTGDPYEPLEGRIDGFSDGVLASIDASLRVLPKERIQSAADWLAMMDGAVPAAPVFATKQVAANDNAASSGGKAGLMVGVAVMALAAAGIGGYATGMFGATTDIASTELVSPVETSAVSQQDQRQSSKAISNDNGPVETTAASQAATEAASDISAEAIATDTGLANVPADAQDAGEPVLDASAETLAPDPGMDGRLAVEQTRQWPAEAEESLEETLDEIEAAVRIAGAPEISEFPIARPTVEGDTLVTDLSEDEKIAPEATGLSNASLIQEDETMADPITETQAPEVAAVVLPDTPAPAPEKASQAIEERLIDLNRPDVATNIDMPVSPATPDALETQLAAIDRLAVLPALPSTPVPGPGVNQANLPANDALALPDSVQVELSGFTTDLGAAAAPQASGGWTRTLEVEAPVFGAEIVPVVAESTQPETQIDGALVKTDWAITLPFNDLRADQDGGLWIRTVEGLPVERREDLTAVLKQMYDLSGVDEVTLNLGLGLRNGDPMLDQNLTLAVVQQTLLPNGLQFEARAEDGAWVTRVTEVPNGFPTDLREGDVLFAHVETGDRFTGRMTLPDVLNRELAAGQTNINFAVKRDGNVWLAAMNNGAN